MPALIAKKNGQHTKNLHPHEEKSNMDTSTAEKLVTPPGSVGNAKR
jgi:hypothetical protein